MEKKQLENADPVKEQFDLLLRDLLHLTDGYGPIKKLVSLDSTTIDVSLSMF